jgi:hypothetical protein
MSDRAYRGIYYDEPHVQAEFERLLELVRAAERARAPIGERHRQAEQGNDAGTISDSEYNSADAAYVAAGNKIAAAQRAVDKFLQENRNYRTR